MRKYVYIYIISQLLMPLRGFGKIGSWAAWKKPKNKIYGFFIFKKKTYYFYWGIKTNLEKFKYQMV